MSNEQVEQSSDGTQLNIEPTKPEASSVTFPSGKVEDHQFEAEKRAFKTYVETSGQAVPENFNDADAWFSSLKEAQANYTRGQQEIATLREEYATQGISEDSPSIVEEPLVKTEPVITSDSPELRIQEQTIEESAAEAASIGVNQETYEAWAMEMAATGKISDETRVEIQNKTGFSDNMIDDYVSGQKARLRENFAKASSVVGGQERLQKVFDWAGKNLSPEDQQMINMGLASPSYEVTLRGLSSMYDNSVTSAKASEPDKNQNLATVPASETGIRAYGSKSEFTKERNDPRFSREGKFRNMVESRMSMTDWNHLPQH
jgi:hypothetical protein